MAHPFTSPTELRERLGEVGYLADDVMGKPPDFLFDLQDPEDKGLCLRRAC